jgi:hypothetical protein
MKKNSILIFLVFCVFKIHAQSNYEIYKPVDTINSLLYKNRNIYFIDKGEIIKIKKIQANPNGVISIVNNTKINIDTTEITTFVKNKPFINLFEFEKIKIVGSKLEFKSDENRVYRTIYGFNNKDIVVFKKQIELLQTSYAKDKSIRYIKRYYFDFKTGYNTPGGFFTVTDNYKVKLLNGIFTMSFDTFMYKKFQKTKKISFDLKDIVSIYNGGTETLTFENDFVVQPVCNIIGIKTKTITYNLFIKYQKHTAADQTEIYKAFEEVINSYKKQK